MSTITATAVLPDPGITAPAMTDCLGCGRDIPASEVWCSWTCRNFDDRHDD